VIEIADLTHVNAALNAATIVCLGMGLWFILRGDRQRHRAAMLAALAVSVTFLVTYLIYHVNAGLAKFGGYGLIRPIYFTLLLLHVLAAVVITPLVPVTVFRALSGRYDRHRKIARWTWPLWMYVAVSGVVVYVMAVHMYPYAAGTHAG
jgi:uncharacterized membrane protein YozB (DUF420 family)